MPESQTALLAVLPDNDDWLALHAAFPGMQRATTVRECAERLAQNGISVIVSNRDFIDGTWRDLLAAARAVSGRVPRVVVMARAADESLWQEVLDAGGFDLLPKPADLRQLLRAVEAAQASWSGAAYQAAAGSLAGAR